MFNTVIREIIQKADVDSMPLYMAAVWLHALRNDGRHTPLLNCI
jgi:hypothetical protein